MATRPLEGAACLRVRFIRLSAEDFRWVYISFACDGPHRFLDYPGWIAFLFEVALDSCVRRLASAVPGRACESGLVHAGWRCVCSLRLNWWRAG